AGGSRTQATGLNLTDGTSSGASDFHTVSNNDLSNNTTNALALTTTGTSHQNNKIANNQGYNPRGPSVTQLAVPAANGTTTNTTGVDVWIEVAGGTSVNVAIG